MSTDTEGRPLKGTLASLDLGTPGGPGPNPPSYFLVNFTVSGEVKAVFTKWKKKRYNFFLTCIIDDQELTGYHTHWNIWVFLCSHGNKKKKMTSKRNSSVRREVWDSLRTFVFVIIGGACLPRFVWLVDWWSCVFPPLCAIPTGSSEAGPNSGPSH